MVHSPKQHFLVNSSAVKAHQETVDSAEFLVAAQASLLQLVVNLPDTTDPTIAAAAYHRIVGARQYLNQIISIADKTKPPEVVVPLGQLDHDA